MALPYTTLLEAQAAMGGRPLTAAETLWFRYTASVPDAYLFSLNLLFIFLIFHVFSTPSLVLDLLARSAFPYLRRFKLHPNSFLDAASLLRCYSGVMLSYTCVVSPLVYLSNHVFKFVGIRTSLPLPSIWEILAELVVYAIVDDYITYWIHRLSHTEWGYNTYHYKHHEFKTLTSMCGSYTDWLEMLIASLPTFLGPAVVPGHIVTLWLWFALRQIIHLDVHSGFGFPWAMNKLVPFLVTSEYHHHHHLDGKSQGNFTSIFTYCDYIYGTNKVRKQGELEVLYEVKWPLGIEEPWEIEELEEKHEEIVELEGIEEEN
ncbi:hypothetical protein L7F22_021173 [Adiantum nelumboides]|nr:hypothetical protein [Adiantum nelumboides]